MDSYTNNTALDSMTMRGSKKQKTVHLVGVFCILIFDSYTLA